jgi:hypothetical protein
MLYGSGVLMTWDIFWLVISILWLLLLIGVGAALWFA